MSDSTSTSDSTSIDEARRARITQLEEALAKPRAPGVRPVTAVMGLVAVGVLLWMLRLDLAYFFSPRVPLQLGSEGDYRLTSLVSNRYVEVHGVPTLRGAYARENDAVYVVVGLRDTPLLVRREALPTETWEPGTLPPRPDQRPFSVRGRMLVEQDAPRFADGFRKHREMGEVRPREGQLWVVLESQRPGEDTGVLLAALSLVLFACLNLWLLARRLMASKRAVSPASV